MRTETVSRARCEAADLPLQEARQLGEIEGALVHRRIPEARVNRPDDTSPVSRCGRNSGLPCVYVHNLCKPVWTAHREPLTSGHSRASLEGREPHEDQATVQGGSANSDPPDASEGDPSRQTSSGRGLAPSRRRPSVIGRQQEKAQLGSLLAGLDDSGGAVHVIGPAGIGKSTLVGQALESAATRADRLIVSVSAHESESLLPFAGAAQLLAPLAPRIWTLPPELRQALAPCLGLTPPRQGSPLAEYTAALTLITTSPIPPILAVDNSHWLDKESANLIGYVGRRLDGNRAVVIASGRPALRGLRSWGLPVLELSGLDLDDCRKLTHLHGVELTDLELKRLHAWTGGNPQAVLDNLTRPGRGEPGSPDEFTLSHGLRAAYDQLLASLSPATREAIYVLVADQPSGGSHVRTAVERLGLPSNCLTPLESLHLASVGRDTARLLNPLLGHLAAVRTSPHTRSAVHQVLAELSIGHERAWHLAANARLPDDSVAEALASAALDARRSAGFPASSRTWQRAAELTTDPCKQAERFLTAATDSFLSGDGARALICCAAASIPTLDPEFTACRLRVEALARASVGDPHGAVDCLLDAASAVGVDEPTTAANLLAEAAVPAATTGRYWLAQQVAATALGSAVAADERSFRLVVLCAHAFTMTGQLQRAESLLSVATSHLADADQLLDQLSLARLCQALLWAGAPDRAARLANKTVDRATSSRAAGALAQALVVRSEIRWWAGMWGSAREDAARAADLAEESHQSGILGEALTMQARIMAGTGDTAACEATIERLHTELEPTGAMALGIHAAASRGLLSLGCGDLGRTIDDLDAAFEIAQEAGLANPMVIPIASDLGEALARSGQPRRASLVAAWLEALGDATGLLYASATALRLRAMLHDEPEAAMDRLAHARALLSDPPLPFDIARTLLCEGQVLRRAQRVADARDLLRRALHGFQGLGATSWVTLTENELAATGLRHEHGRRTGGSDVLSPQELQVARAVSRGMNNPEVAASLFMSRKTVESHLTRIYRKLGLHSRTDLTRVVLRDGLDTEHTPVR